MALNEWFKAPVHRMAAARSPGVVHRPPRYRAPTRSTAITGRLADALTRFNPYTARFAGALHRLRAGDLDAFTMPLTRQLPRRLDAAPRGPPRSPSAATAPAPTGPDRARSTPRRGREQRISTTSSARLHALDARDVEDRNPCSNRLIMPTTPRRPVASAAWVGRGGRRSPRSCRPTGTGRAGRRCRPSPGRHCSRSVGEGGVRRSTCTCPTSRTGCLRVCACRWCTASSTSVTSGCCSSWRMSTSTTHRGMRCASPALLGCSDGCTCG